MRLQNIGKSFPGVRALHNISFNVKSGEVHCICGENGAGKSTLIKIISGAYQPDEGDICFEGKRVNLNPKYALGLGIQTIYQELNFYRHLNVIENIFTGSEITRFGIVQKKEMRKKTEAILQTLNVNFSPDTLMSELTAGEQKLVEIAKGLVFQHKIMILDEPTASLSASETEHILEIVRKVRNAGLGIIYISHHLDELFVVGDRVTVLRDGLEINTYNIPEIDEPRLIRDMVGRDASAFYNREFFAPGEVILEAEGITGNGVSGVSFNLRRGEILGFAGMIGSGRSELMNVIFGGARQESGSLKIYGNMVRFKSPTDAIRQKMCFITEDRQASGLFLQHTIARNTIIANMVNTKSLFETPKHELKDGEEYIVKLGTKARNAAMRVVNLSGGNQQKVVLAKWFLTNGDIFIFDEPTRGIDVGSKQEIYRIMIDLVKQGKAVIMVSSDMPELVSMSDRVIVMRKRTKIAELARNEISEENILSHSIGGKAS
ncbi:MAG: sugar ABC transporter ATP-binding protein [Treponema sp.]|nr:sugar ABC transporter ATP-binding protein [Treponema sp.]